MGKAKQGAIREKTAPADWDGIVGTLEKWLAALQSDKGTEGSDSAAVAASGSTAAAVAASGSTAAAATASGSTATTASVTTVAESYRRDPWAVLSSTILSLRTKDEVTLVRSRALLEKAPTPKKLLALTTEEIEKLIYPVGFYHTKARNLQKIAALILEHHGGQVPSTMEELLALPGVGRKTANLTLTEAFDLDGICVDVHVHRITNRLGALQSKNPEETEMLLREILPKKYWRRLNMLLVLYGQRVCRPVSPFCSRCVMARYCGRVGVERSR